MVSKCFVLTRPILTAHFCRKQCANDNPTTLVVFTYNCFAAIVSLIYQVRYVLEVYRKHIAHYIEVVQCESVLRKNSLGFKNKSNTIFTCITRASRMCCRHLALSASSKTLPRLSGKHGPSEKLENWRQARNRERGGGNENRVRAGCDEKEKRPLSLPLSLIIKWGRVSRFCAFNFRRFYYNFNDIFLRSTSDLRGFFS